MRGRAGVVDSSFEGRFGGPRRRGVMDGFLVGGWGRGDVRFWGQGSFVDVAYIDIETGMVCELRYMVDWLGR